MNQGGESTLRALFEPEVQMGKFKNREDAGRRLGQRVKQIELESPLVMGLARGGIVVGASVANAIGGELAPLVVRKVASPNFPEYAVAAIAPRNIQVRNEDALRGLGIHDSELKLLIENESVELWRRRMLYGSVNEEPNLKQRSVVLVDDGLATGLTAIAAVEYVKTFSPKIILFAVPVCSVAGRKALEPMVGRVVSLIEPISFRAVGDWYECFDQTGDSEVLRILAAGSSGTRLQG